MTLGIPISELQHRISYREFQQYWAFYQLEPWGGDIDDLRMGITVSNICNAVRMDKGKPYKPKDFMPKYDQSPTDRDSKMNLAKAKFAALADIQRVMEEKKHKKEEA